MIDYQEFKQKFRHLYNTWSALPENQKNLDCYVEARAKAVEKTQSLCGCSACLCGVLPLAFPKEFKYSQHGFYVDILPADSVDRRHPDNAENIYALAGIDIHIDYIFDREQKMVSLFGPNGFEHTDQEEVDRRMEIVENANSYEELIEGIRNRVFWPAS